LLSAELLTQSIKRLLMRSKKMATTWEPMEVDENPLSILSEE